MELMHMHNASRKKVFFIICFDEGQIYCDYLYNKNDHQGQNGGNTLNIEQPYFFGGIGAINTGDCHTA